MQVTWKFRHLNAKSRLNTQASSPPCSATSTPTLARTTGCYLSIASWQKSVLTISATQVLIGQNEMAFAVLFPPMNFPSVSSQILLPRHSSARAGLVYSSLSQCWVLHVCVSKNPLQFSVSISGYFCWLIKIVEVLLFKCISIISSVSVRFQTSKYLNYLNNTGRV